MVENAKEVTSAKFTDFPAEMDKYFTENEVVIKTIPEHFVNVIEKKMPFIKISSADQYDKLLLNAQIFYKHSIFNKRSLNGLVQNLNNAISNYNAAKTSFLRKDNSNGNSYLSHSITVLTSGFLHPKTELAKFILQYENYLDDFFTGLSYAFSNQNTNSYINVNANLLKGMIVGLEYCKVIKSAQTFSKKEIAAFEETVKIATENFAELNKQYTISFHEQEKRLAEIKQDVDDFFDKRTQRSDELENIQLKRCEELENTYENKLRIEKPADYWKTMSNNYKKQGRNWLIASCLIAVLIIAMLICIIAFVPNIFDSSSHWFDIVKNSAIITVIAGVAIYVLRLFVKMAMSSFHLARDAKEREQLSYYYLALIKNSAITDKERALIINSLFSRSDTGLLKGDASPTLTANVAELVDKITKE